MPRTVPEDSGRVRRRGWLAEGRLRDAPPSQKQLKQVGTGGDAESGSGNRRALGAKLSMTRAQVGETK